MDTRTLLGGSPLGVVLRLAVISLIVGIVLSALGITPENLFYRLDLLIRRIYDLGFGAFEWVLGYFLLGAMIVVPIWLLARFFGVMKTSDTRNDDKSNP